MLEEALLTLAGAAAAAIAKAMGTDAWKVVKPRVARLFGRRNRAQQHVVEACLDDDAAAVERAEGAERVEVVEEFTPVWRRKLIALLEDCSEDERTELATELRAVVDIATPDYAGDDVGLSVVNSVAGRDINQIGSVGGDFSTGGGHG
jgi:hypothetical protein